MPNYTNMQNISRSIIIMGFRIEFYANKHIFEPLGLTSSSYKIMAILHHNEGVSPIEMLEKLGCSKSNITQRLNFLEKQKLVTRFHNGQNSDKRKVIIKLTKLGEEKYSKVIKIMRKRAESLEKFFTKEEIDCHVAFIKKLHNIINDLEKSKTLIKIS